MDLMLPYSLIQQLAAHSKSMHPVITCECQQQFVCVSAVELTVAQQTITRTCKLILESVCAKPYVIFPFVFHVSQSKDMKEFRPCASELLLANCSHKGSRGKRSAFICVWPARRKAFKRTEGVSMSDFANAALYKEKKKKTPV